MRERYFRLAWVTALFLAQLAFLKTWELTSDDGNTLFTAWRFFEEPFWFGHTNSVGMLHLPFAYAQLGLFLAVGGTPFAAQIGILLTYAAAHWLLVEAGARLRNPAVGYGASAFAFASPAFFPIYGQKFWEPVAIPLFSMAALHAALEWQRTGKGAWLAGAFGAVLLAVGGHMNALFLFAALGVVAWPRRREIGAGVVLAAAAAVAAGISPFFAWHRSGIPTHGAPLAASLAAAAGLACLALPLRLLGRALLVALVALGLSFVVRSNPGENAVRVLADLLSPVAQVAAERTGAPETGFAWAWGLGGILAAVFLLRAGARLEREAGERRVVFLWLAVPIAICFAEAVVFRRMAHHWLLFLFPSAWLAVADGLFGLAERIPFRRGLVPFGAATAAILAVMAGESLRIERQIAGTGGVAVHMASLAVKSEVLERISQFPGVPEVYQVRIPYGTGWEVDYEGWRWMCNQARRTAWAGRAGPGKHFYVHQERGLSSQPELLPVLRAAPGVREERIGPVTLFISDGPVEGAGVKLL